MTIWLILIIFGSIMIVEALPIFISPEKMKEYYKRMSILDPNTLRFVAFIMLVVGLIIVFLVRAKICL